MRCKIQQNKFRSLSHPTLESLLKLQFPDYESQHQATGVEDDLIFLK